jgi:hypothetical protein
MNNSQIQDQLGRQIAARLTLGNDQLPHEVVERLRAGRAQALAQRNRASAQWVSVRASGRAGEATLQAGDEGGGGWGRRLAAVVPLLALVAGLVAINVVQSERRANELAEVDAALLTDALPPAAYADPGFLQFLKSEQ